MTHLIRVFPALSIAVLALLAAEWRRAPKRPTRPIGLTCVTVLLVLVTWPPATWLALGTLEWRYPRAPKPAGDAEAIVVLSAAVHVGYEGRPYTLVGHGTYVRCMHAAWLYKNWRQVPVVCGGGPVEGEPGGITFAEAMRDFLIHQGVPADDVWVETKSRNTHQNAVHAAELLSRRGIRRVALVTEAYHMLRAERCFRRQGLEVVPAPCGFRTAGFGWRLACILPGHDSLRSTEHVLHEWLGLAWYWLRGWL